MDRFSALIIGGGILGVVTAAAAAVAGFRPLVLRLSDRVRPQAETLRNQGWLQSGIRNRFHDFPSLEAFADFGLQNYIHGRQMLRDCGLPIPSKGGLIYSKDSSRIAELHKARELLGLPDEEFRQLDACEARDLCGECWHRETTYFRSPDVPFDEAGVLEHYRRTAKAGGAAFIELDEPAKLTRLSDGVRVAFEDFWIDSPLVVVAAGAGSFELMAQYGEKLNGTLNCTPLLVADAPESMPAPIIADLDKGFSAVRHERGGDPPAVVMGTRVKLRDVPFVGASERVIHESEQQEFREKMPPPFDQLRGRFTAGFELVPPPRPRTSPYRPWIETRGNVILASPGRATIATLAASLTLERIIEHWRSDRRQTTALDVAACRQWEAPIAMHYMRSYDFNDAEVAREARH